MERNRDNSNNNRYNRHHIPASSLSYNLYPKVRKAKWTISYDDDDDHSNHANCCNPLSSSDHMDYCHDISYHYHHHKNTRLTSSLDSIAPPRWHCTTTIGTRNHSMKPRDRKRAYDNFLRNKFRSSSSMLLLSPSIIISSSMLEQYKGLLYQTLPKISNHNQVQWIAMGSGIIALLLQTIFTYILRTSRVLQNWFHIPPPSSSQQQQYASYISHTIVAMIFMILVCYVGIVGWWFHPTISLTSSSYDRLLRTEDAARWLTSVVMGVLLLWDIPISIYVKELRKLDVIFHHSLMSIVSYVGAMYIPCYYIYFYFGVSELSTIPLLLYDQISLMISIKEKSFDDRTDQVPETLQSNNHDILVKRQNQLCNIVALSFTIIRAYLFTKVTLLTSFLPDVRHVLKVMNVSYTTTNRSLLFLMISSLIFTSLQLYWFITKIVLAGINILTIDKEDIKT